MTGTSSYPVTESAELARRVESHVKHLANTSMNLPLVDWGAIANDLLEAARALRTVSVAQGWRDIETAPKDGNTVVVWDNPVMGEAYYDIGEKSWWWANTGPGDYTARAIYPTLWHPMPDKPTSPVPSTDGGTRG